MSWVSWPSYLPLKSLFLKIILRLKTVSTWNQTQREWFTRSGSSFFPLPFETDFLSWGVPTTWNQFKLFLQLNHQIFITINLLNDFWNNFTDRSSLGKFRIVVIFRTIRGSVEPDPDSTFGSVFFFLLGDLWSSTADALFWDFSNEIYIFFC